MSQNRGDAKNSEEKGISAGFITKASSQYCDKFPLRAAIQAIPWLGSSLDTMLAGLGAKWKYERLEDFISKLNERLSRLKQSGTLPTVQPSEALYDFLMQTFDQVIRARSEEKRKRFANLVSNQVVNLCDWDEADAACRLIGDLSDIHVRVLQKSIEVGESSHFLEGLRGVTFCDKFAHSRDSKNNIVDLRSIFPSLVDSAISVICSELVSKGLLRDAGIGRFDARPMELFVTTDLAKWLMDWISEPEEKKNTGDSN